MLPLEILGFQIYIIIMKENKQTWLLPGLEEKGVYECIQLSFVC